MRGGGGNFSLGQLILGSGREKGNSESSTKITDLLVFSLADFNPLPDDEPVCLWNETHVSAVPPPRSRNWSVWTDGSPNAPPLNRPPRKPEAVVAS